jgi:hypothetical protein
MKKLNTYSVISFYLAILLGLVVLLVGGSTTAAGGNTRSR